MVSGRFASATKLIPRLAAELKKDQNIVEPSWAKFVKTGAHRERPPQQPDFWQTRAASVLRRIYLEGPVGTQRLRTYYGKTIKWGYKPKHFTLAGGNQIRKVLQQLEKAGYIEKDGKAGRKITAKGRKFFDGVAKSASKE
jgi:small subunit ribosomal protein S19e